MDLATLKDMHIDNSVTMMINYLAQIGRTSVELAGIDGFKLNEDNYSYNETNKVIDEDSIKELNISISNGIKELSQKIDINFLTSSLFEMNKKLKVIGVIPARYASTRLKAKPLVDIGGIPMVIHVMKRAMMCDILDDVIVATDNQEIYNVVEQYGGKAMMTLESHDNGTLRMQEISTMVNGDIFVL